MSEVSSSFVIALSVATNAPTTAPALSESQGCHITKDVLQDKEILGHFMYFKHMSGILNALLS